MVLETSPVDRIVVPVAPARVHVMLPVPRDRVVFRTPLPESVKGAQKVGLGVCDAPRFTGTNLDLMRVIRPAPA